MSLRGRVLLLVTALMFTSVGLAADTYVVDAAHAAAVFKVSHLGLSWTHGRFRDLSGTFTVDEANPAATKFELTAKVESLDTDNEQRDKHLKSPDFLNAKQFPTVSFKSTSVVKSADGYQVTGDLTLHGVTKPVSFALVGGRKAELPKGVWRTGYTGELKIKRSEFGLGQALEMIGDEVHISMSFEGTKK